MTAQSFFDHFKRYGLEEISARVGEEPSGDFKDRIDTLFEVVTREFLKDDPFLLRLPDEFRVVLRNYALGHPAEAARFKETGIKLFCLSDLIDYLQLTARRS